MSSLPIIQGFSVVEWDCDECHAENYADDFGPVQCHWCERWYMVMPRTVRISIDAQKVKTVGKFEQPNRKPK